MLYRRGNIWWYEFRFRGARIRESADTDSKTIARRVEFERRRQLEESAGSARRREPQLFRKASATYLARKQASVAPKTMVHERGNLAHLLPYFGGRLLTDIEAEDISRYQGSRSGEGAAPATINHEIGTLRAILRREGLWERVQRDVSPLRVADDVGRAISLEEEERLLRACAQSRSRALYPAVVLALNTGLRYGELTALTWERVDLERRLLKVGKSKTASGEGRSVPLNERAHSVLAMWAERLLDRRPNDFVFCSEKYGQGGAVFSLDVGKPVGRLKEAWEAAKRRTADPEHGIAAVSCRWHDLRHTFCTRMVESGSQLPLLAVVMGWSPATTTRMVHRYGHPSIEVLRALVSSLKSANFQPDSPQNPPQEGGAKGGDKGELADLIGSSGRTRTSNPPVNSRMLCH